MSASNYENEKNLQIVEKYYSSMVAKDFNSMENFLHESVHFMGPLSKMHGKEDVVRAAKNLCQILDKIEIRSRFSRGNQVMLAYDLFFEKLNLILPAAVLMTIEKSKIIKIELFYDGRPFEKEKDKIFEK